MFYESHTEELQKLKKASDQLSAKAYCLKAELNFLKRLEFCGTEMKTDEMNAMSIFYDLLEFLYS